MKSLITKKQVLKMLKFVPKRSAEAGGFESNEFDERFLTAQEKFSTGACEVLAPRIESLFRAMVSEGMQRAHEYGKSSVDVTTMASVLRPYAKNTLFNTEKPPPGIIGHAFNKGILNPTDVDDENQDEMMAEAARQQAAEDEAQGGARQARRGALGQVQGVGPRAGLCEGKVRGTHNGVLEGFKKERNKSLVASMVDAAYLLFLEPPEEEVNRSHTLSQRLLDCAIQTFQPPPTMMHVEILLPPSQSEEHLLHFATYIGAKSGWQLGHKENVGYYLRGENAGRWRAVPVFASDAVVRIRQECELERGVPYSLARYVSSVYPFRALASALSEERRAPAHCATLTARVLKNALGYGAPVPQSANWYGPASLYSAVSAHAAAVSAAWRFRRQSRRRQNTWSSCCARQRRPRRWRRWATPVARTRCDP